MSVSRVDSLTLSVSELARPTEPSLAGPSETEGPSTFESVLGQAIDQVSSMNATASQKIDALASGAVDDLHGTMISMKEADIAVKLVGTVRNKILDAFQELWRTSV